MRIYPEVTVGNTNLGNLNMHNVVYPEGIPWRGEEKIAVTPTISATPFEWPEIHVPTPEELGLKDTLK